MAKVRLKLSGCFRPQRNAAAWCRIASGLRSMAARGCHPLAAIAIALAGQVARMIDHDDWPSVLEKG